MARPKKMRNLLGILKDKASLIKATLLLSTKPTTSFHLAILRATTHHPIEPPPDYTLDDVLALGHHHHLHRPTASSLVDVLLRRLHRTHNAYVALKCLLILHHIISRGSPLLRDQISSHQSDNNKLLNLSTFRDQSDSDTWELSNWVRWYAETLEQTLIASRSLGFFFLSPLTSQTQKVRNSNSSITSLIRELACLVNMVGQTCRAPDSLHYQRISLVYEVMKLVGEDYRITMREISARVTEINERIEDLNDDGLRELSGNLKTMEECREKVLLMFLNKKKNDGAWDFIAQMRKDVEKVKERRENMRLVSFRGTTTTGSTRFEEGESRDSRPLAIVPAKSGKRWLDVAWNPLVVSRA